MNQLLTVNENGLYCSEANVYIDPWKPVEKALITHAHSDHARWGSKKYLAQKKNENILKLRLGEDIKLETLDYDQTISINGVKFSFHPAGHIFGSSQIKIDFKGEVWVVTGDFKMHEDNVSDPFEPVICDTLITESTFGLPVFKWKNPKDIFNQINNWWRENANENKASVICAYALGKAQRLIKNVDTSIGEIFVHGSIRNVNEVLSSSGLNLPKTSYATADISKDRFQKSLIVAPPSAMGTSWIRRFGDYEVATASGWMNVRGIKRRRNAGKGFVISDHADWSELNQAVIESRASKVYVTHGYKDVFSRWLNQSGIESYVMDTLYEGEVDDS